MQSLQETKPVEDSIAKVNDDLAVGSDPGFQSKWERFERVIWIVLIVFIVLSAAGLFGRGPLAKAHARSPDGSLDITYERIERFGAPSVMRIRYSPAAVQNGFLPLWVSDALIKGLGAQRVVPQPAKAALENNGISYSFPVTGT